MKSPLTLADIEQMRTIAENGGTISDAATALNRAWKSIETAALRHGIVFRQVVNR